MVLDFLCLLSKWVDFRSLHILGRPSISHSLLHPPEVPILLLSFFFSLRLDTPSHITMASTKDELMPIAIVGMSCRLPGNVSSPGEFWQLLSKARSGWSKIPKSRFNDEAYRHPNPEKKGTFNSTGGYFLNEDLEMFDPGFFDMTKKEAETMVRSVRVLCLHTLDTNSFPRILYNACSLSVHTRLLKTQVYPRKRSAAKTWVSS